MPLLNGVVLHDENLSVTSFTELNIQPLQLGCIERTGMFAWNSGVEDDKRERTSVSFRINHIIDWRIARTHCGKLGKHGPEAARSS